MGAAMRAANATKQAGTVHFKPMKIHMLIPRRVNLRTTTHEVATCQKTCLRGCLSVGGGRKGEGSAKGTHVMTYVNGIEEL